jgi:Fe-S-cluster containining protein
MKFECKKCGHCCRFLQTGGNVNCLPVWEWELEKLRGLAEQKNIILNLKPVDLVLDKRSGLTFCIHYWLDAPCPFLIDNKCSIYEDRPLICKAFPMVDNPYFSKEIMEVNIADCKAFSVNKWRLALKGTLDYGAIKVSKKDIIDRYRKFFGDECFINSFLINQIKAYVDKTMKELVQEKKIRL